MKKENENAGIFALLGLILALPLAAWSGFVISKLWEWFVSPLGVPHLSVWHAAGVSVLIRLLTTDAAILPTQERTPAEKFGFMLGWAVLLPALSLGFGALYLALS